MTKPDLNFASDDIRLGVLALLECDDTNFGCMRALTHYVLYERRKRVLHEREVERASYDRLYGHYKEGDLVPAKVNRKIVKINRMITRLNKLIEAEVEANFVNYAPYYAAIRQKLSELLQDK